MNQITDKNLKELERKLEAERLAMMDKLREDLQAVRRSMLEEVDQMKKVIKSDYVNVANLKLKNEQMRHEVEKFQKILKIPPSRESTSTYRSLTPASQSRNEDRPIRSRALHPGRFVRQEKLERGNSGQRRKISVDNFSSLGKLQAGVSPCENMVPIKLNTMEPTDKTQMSTKLQAGAPSCTNTAPIKQQTDTSTEKNKISTKLLSWLSTIETTPPPPHQKTKTYSIITKMSLYKKPPPKKSSARWSSMPCLRPERSPADVLTRADGCAPSPGIDVSAVQQTKIADNRKPILPPISFGSVGGGNEEGMARTPTHGLTERGSVGGSNVDGTTRTQTHGLTERGSVWGCNVEDTARTPTHGLTERGSVWGCNVEDTARTPTHELTERGSVLKS